MDLTCFLLFAVIDSLTKIIRKVLNHNSQHTHVALKKKQRENCIQKYIKILKLQIGRDIVP